MLPATLQVRSRHVLCSLYCIAAGLLSATSPLMADDAVEVRARDIILGESGILQGSVVDTTAQPVENVQVEIFYNDRKVATSVSDTEGRFAVKGLRNGLHTVHIGDSRHPIRFWSADTAPDAAVRQVAVVVDTETVRGQLGTFPRPRIVTRIPSGRGAMLLIATGVAVTLGTTANSDNEAGAPPASP